MPVPPARMTPALMTVACSSARPNRWRGHPVTVMHSVRAWAAADPAHPMVAERDASGGWRICGYGEAVAAADAIGQALLDRGLGPGRPLLVLSGNGVDHLLVTLGAMTAGIPVAPVSVAYSLQSHDHARIRAITELIRPRAVFADDADRLRGGAGRDRLGAGHRELRAPGRERPASASSPPPSPAPRSRPPPTPWAGRDREDPVHLRLHGHAEGVLNTHRMLAANQQMIRQVWPFLAPERP